MYTCCIDTQNKEISSLILYDFLPWKLRLSVTGYSMVLLWLETVFFNSICWSCPGGKIHAPAPQGPGLGWHELSVKAIVVSVSMDNIKDEM